MALHAPELKVLVYDGWQKDPVPITLGEAEVDASKMGKKGRKASTALKISIHRNRALQSKGSKKPSDTSQAGPSNLKPVKGNVFKIVNDEEMKDWPSYVNQFDVCVTTYNVLQHDLDVARAPIDRPRRDVAHYSSTKGIRSPLILCEWYRVIMDEVQMVGGGKAQYALFFIAWQT